MSENQAVIVTGCLSMIAFGVWFISFQLDAIRRKLDAPSKEAK